MNAAHPIYTAKVLIDKLVKRKEKSALVVTSSFIAKRPYADLVMHSASKSFSSFLAQGLAYELKGKVDCLAWECGKTATRMLENDPTAIAVPTAVKGMLRDLGKETKTYGCFSHSWMVAK